jgi:purine-nucleoside phosphorylase
LKVSDTIAAARRALASSGLGPPRVGVILGSGLGPLADRIQVRGTAPFSSLPGFPAATVPGHEGTLIFGELNGVPVAVMKGRIHAYEGHPLPVVGLTARVLCGLGIRALVVTNAAGGLQPDWHPGDVMLIRDHLNLLGGSPLEGAGGADLGPRFPDVSRVYDEGLRALAGRVAGSLAPRLREGVYAAVRGPQYETPAEVRMLARLGADAVGMSTVPEVIVAAQSAVPVLGLSLISNLGAGISPVPLDHRDVLEAGRRSAGEISGFLERVIAAMPAEEITPSP